MNRKNISIQTILHLLLAVMAVAVFFTQLNKKDTKEYPVRLRFYGEYSQDGGAWASLEDVELSALDGDLILRGYFGMQIPENSTISFYLFHLDAAFEVNGVPLIREKSDVGGERPFCHYARWVRVQTPRIAAGDEVRIRLVNPHGIGNAQAYKLFLSSFRLGQDSQVRNAISEQYLSRKLMGLIVIVFALALMAIALVFFVLRIPRGGRLWPIGLMALCYGGYLCLSSPAAALNEDWASVNAFLLYLCVIVAVMELSAILHSYLTDLRKQVVSVMLLIQSLGLVVLVIVHLVGALDLCQTMSYWMPMQISFAVVASVLALWEWFTLPKRSFGILSVCGLLLLVIILETANEFLLLWPERLLIELSAALFFFSYAVHGAVSIPLSFRAASQAEKLKSDLDQSRIVLAMSQIRAHFIFNVLNAISGMCKYDPHKADETVLRFARYLRGNIDVMQEDRLESFSTTLRHLEDYVALEQIRFGDLISFRVNAEVQDFSLPPLVLQPIVENAIKHGLTPKSEGGTIYLHTCRVEKNIMISIADDGVGFNTAELAGKDSIGLSNVRFRLKQIVGGEMQIESIPERGTVVVITIPNQEKHVCE